MGTETVPTITDKVIAYVTRRGHLLVFRHPAYPEAGIQVPAGTVDPGESPQAAVLREAREETGLSALRITRFLGVREYDLSAFGRDEVHRRHFFHVEVLEEVRSGWRHWETSPSEGEPVEFEFYWVRLPDLASELSGGQGELLSELADAV
jgi:8-oxo-dGTP pyrophosphatase MutT (NUDIX family)